MRDDRMMIRADARAIGAVTATDTRGSERWKSSRTKSGECVSIFPDGTRIPFVRTKSRKTTSTRIVAAPGMSYGDRLARFGAIGNGESD